MCPDLIDGKVPKYLGPNIKFSLNLFFKPISNKHMMLTT